MPPSSTRISVRPLSAAEGPPLLEPEDSGVGQILAGKYHIDSVIGAGAMGVVVRATHLDFEEPVAIKFIRREMQNISGVVGRFAREAKALARIKSEHVARVLDIGVSDPVGPYIVMELLEGENLACVLAARGQLPVEVAVGYVLQTCEALAAAHAVGITHRDVKPDNLFLVRSGQRHIIKLIDFGVSKSSLTGMVFGDDISLFQTTFAVGTPLYMSPEQIRADEVDARTDIWALGATMYELLTGCTAFVGNSLTQVCARVLESTPQPMRLLRADLAPALQAVLDRCLEKDPARRFQNVSELAFALLPFAELDSELHAKRAHGLLGLHSALRSDVATLNGVESAPGRAEQSLATQSLAEHSLAAQMGVEGNLADEREALASPASTAAVVAEVSGHTDPAVNSRRGSSVWLVRASAAFGALALLLLLSVFMLSGTTAPRRERALSSAPTLSAHSMTELATPPAPLTSALHDVPPSVTSDSTRSVTTSPRSTASARAKPPRPASNRAGGSNASQVFSGRVSPPVFSAAPVSSIASSKQPLHGADRPRIRLVEDSPAIKLLQ